jgi:hypothetical protein
MLLLLHTHMDFTECYVCPLLRGQLRLLALALHSTARFHSSSGLLTSRLFLSQSQLSWGGGATLF